MADSTQLSDQYLLAKTLEKHSDVQVSSGSKNVVYIPDNSYGSYKSGSISYDLTSALTGSEGFGSLAESYIMLPYVVTMGTSGKLDPDKNKRAPYGRYSLTLKSGAFNVINDLSLELNGKQVLSPADYKMFWNNFRKQTESSVGDLTKHGGEDWFNIDDWKAVRWSNTASTYGDGFCANAINNLSSTLDKSHTQSVAPWQFNEGFFKRLMNNPMVVDTTDSAGAFGWPTHGTNATQQISIQSGKRCFREFAVSNRYITIAEESKIPDSSPETVGEWYYMLKLKLVDLHPIFRSLPLCGAMQMKLRISVNSGTTTIAGVSANQAKLEGTVFDGTSKVCPVMLAPFSEGSPMGPHESDKPRIIADQKLHISFGALQNKFTTAASAGNYLPYNTSRIYIPFYNLDNPSQIISNPVKKVKFLDCAAEPIRNKTGSNWPPTTGANANKFTLSQNASFTYQLSNTLKNTKYIVLTAFSDTTQAHYTSAKGVEQFASPFDSAPATSAFGNALRNVQFTLGNKNVFTRPQDFDYELFSNEMSKINALNGDNSPALVTGLIDSLSYSFSHKYYVADLSRLSEKDVPQSITISGTNISARPLDLICHVIYERELEINMLTGEVGYFSP
ncbi:hypothetical protein PybrP1_000605 [[Pythium] brassicae (nom. inval.)]|nr:hypothetical protein PybrP1_000605 [[Pythium] brassicae (nom. inval.)]